MSITNENVTTDSAEIIKCDRCKVAMRKELIAIDDECYICPVCGAYKPAPKLEVQKLRTVMPEADKKKCVHAVAKSQPVVSLQGPWVDFFNPNPIGATETTTSKKKTESKKELNIASKDDPLVRQIILKFEDTCSDKELFESLKLRATSNSRAVEEEIKEILRNLLVNQRHNSNDKTATDAVRTAIAPFLPNEAKTAKQVSLYAAASTKHSVFDYLQKRSESFISSDEEDHYWLKETGLLLMNSLASRGIPVVNSGLPTLTPNAAVFRIQGGRRVTVPAIESRMSEIFTTDGLQIVSVEPEAGCLRIVVARPTRKVLHTETVFRDYLAQHLNDLASDKILVGIKEDDGEPLVLDPYEQPHTLIAGATGSGKSVLMQNIILSISLTHSPKETQIFLIDPKFGVDYEALEHLPHMSEGIISDQDSSLDLLERAVDEMEKRYRMFKDTGKGINNIKAYRELTGKHLPTWWIIHDEFADWMQTKRYREDVPKLVNRLGVNARAAGIFLVFAGQRPDHTVFPNLLRDQLGNRLILKVQSAGTSNVALGEKGAEKLMGKGHMLAKIGGHGAVLAQVPFIDMHNLPQLVEKICKHHRKSPRLKAVA